MDKALLLIQMVTSGDQAGSIELAELYQSTASDIVQDDVGKLAFCAELERRLAEHRAVLEAAIAANAAAEAEAAADAAVLAEGSYADEESAGW